MDELLLPAGGDTNKAMRSVLAQFDGPAYLRRARRVKAALEQLHERCRRQRDELLTMVRLRLGLLQALAGNLDALMPVLLDADQVTQLQGMHAELKPELRAPVQPIYSPRRLRAALADLTESIQLFNQRWARFVREVDLTEINHLIHGYNRWYVLEKECIVGSPRIARQGFEPMRELTLEDLEMAYPPLNVP